MRPLIRMDFDIILFDNLCSFSYNRISNEAIVLSKDAIVAHGAMNLLDDSSFDVQIYAWIDPRWVDDETITEPIIEELKGFVESILIPTDYRSNQALN